MDGKFVYAVNSTRIYCRPSCPSRRPRRDRVSFYPSGIEARAAGFRSCKRCRPDDIGLVNDAERAAVRAARLIEQAPLEPWTLAELARRVKVSPSHLQRTFARIIGVSPREYRDALRRKRFTERLSKGDTVSRATYEAGYGASSRVYERTMHEGLSPAAVRRGAPGASIRYTTVPTSLGTMLVAATDKGVCSVTIGDDAGELVRELAVQFPRATLTGDDHDMRALATSVARLVEGDTSAEVPLDVKGTAFQWKVWRLLQRIPRGSTRSYAAVAESLGQPTAARAVARACATNPVALVIPCHRVVRGDGSMGGYRWGVSRKERLLARERGEQ